MHSDSFLLLSGGETDLDDIGHRPFFLLFLRLHLQNVREEPLKEENWRSCRSLATGFLLWGGKKKSLGILSLFTYFGF